MLRSHKSFEFFLTVSKAPVTTHSRNPLKDPSSDEVCFKSADGQMFYVKRTALKATTGGFPSAEFASSRSEVTSLTETAQTLELLFQFVTPQRHPDLEDLDFETLAPLAEAVEKYQVFPAMGICNVRMRHFIAEHAAGVISYAAAHDYPKLMKEAAPYFVLLPLAKVVDQLPKSFLVSWVEYREAWMGVLDDAIQDVVQTKQMCSTCQSQVLNYILELKKQRSPHALEKMLAEPGVTVPKQCNNVNIPASGNVAFGMSSPSSFGPSCKALITITKICSDISAGRKKINLSFEL
ncbi:hypothetical protein B0H34DRAFT_401971 [Crassisporium funariophilum]|nr:hypothetical protein B0H34DRAFT_401971 [Crassisporium funariophilum]